MRPGRELLAGYHAAGDGSCASDAGPCPKGFVTTGKSDLCCAAGYRDGGDGRCVPDGSCAGGYVDNNHGDCESPPTAPTLDAPAYVTAGGSYQAKVRVPIWSSTYAWTIEGGTLSADAGDSVIVTAGSSGTVIVSCVENRSGVSSPAGTATTVVVPPPAKPDITAPVLVTVGRAGPVASVEHQGNGTYSWTIEGGKITSGATGPSIAFEAMTTGPIKLNCTVTNITGDSAEGTKEVTSILSAAAPIITAPPAVTGGEEAVAEVEGQPGTTFSWKIDGGEFDEGVDDTSVRFRATSSVPVTLTCTAWNEAGDGTEGVKIVVVFSVPFPDTPVVSRRRSRRVDITPAC